MLLVLESLKTTDFLGISFGSCAENELTLVILRDNRTHCDAPNVSFSWSKVEEY